MKRPTWRIVVLGLSITSSWGNGHATTYRALLRELAGRGHDLLFLERDVEWHASNRDLPQPKFCRVGLYETLAQLKARHGDEIRRADVVVIGSYLNEGITVAEWVMRRASGLVAFYDIDAPVTLSLLEQGQNEYLSQTLIPRFGLYLSLTGGPVLTRLEREFGSPRARALYSSADPSKYFPEKIEKRWDLGYLGRYSRDRHPGLERLLIEPAQTWSAGRFVVAGPQFPESIRWPENIERIEQLGPDEHRSFYNEQRCTLNVTRAQMVKAGFSPAVRLFEAAACGAAIVSDYWPGLETLFVPGEEILIGRSAGDVLSILRDTPERKLRQMGEQARRRFLAEHTSAHRAVEFENHVLEAISRPTNSAVAA